MKIRVKGIEFKKQRLRMGFNQITLAKAVGVSREYISMIENDRVSISPPLADRLASVLKCDFDHIFFISDVHKTRHSENIC